MNALGKMLYRVHELHALHLHHEMDGRAALMTAEAVIKLRFTVHAERRRLLVVEGAAAPETPSLLLQRHIFRNDLLKTRTGPKLVQPCIRKSYGHLLSL